MSKVKPQTKAQKADRAKKRRTIWLKSRFYFIKSLSEFLKHRSHRRRLGLPLIPHVRQKRGRKRKEEVAV